jgi:putative two-component system response regulator
MNMALGLPPSRIHTAPIFVVDDEPVNLKLIQRMLEIDGFSDVRCINDPRTVTERYLQQRPDLILLDINMPFLNGFEVLEELKRIPNNIMPPVVFLTAQSATEFRIKAFDKGVLDFIHKPFNRLELLARVKNLIALEHAHKELEQRNVSLESIVNLRTEALKKTQLQMVQKLGRAAEYRDNETGGHILRMSHIAALLARALGYSEEQAQLLLHASPMHDVGKIAIPDRILLKRDKLDPDEWEIMKSHTTVGHRILYCEETELLQLAAEIALHHHERWDGSGYPHGLAGDAIPQSCRIVAVADVFDALLSKRPYKEVWSLDAALAFINAQAGRHFDPAVVAVFNRHIDDIVAIRNRFCDSVEHCTDAVAVPTGNPA